MQVIISHLSLDDKGALEFTMNIRNNIAKFSRFFEFQVCTRQVHLPGKFFDKTQKVEITAHDTGTGIANIVYYVAEGEQSVE